MNGNCAEIAKHEIVYEAKNVKSNGASISQEKEECLNCQRVLAANCWY